MENTTLQHTESDNISSKSRIRISIGDLQEGIAEFLYKKRVESEISEGDTKRDGEVWGNLDKLFTYLFKVVICPNVEEWEKAKKNGKPEKKKQEFKLENPLSENPEFWAFLFYMDFNPQFNYNFSYLKAHVSKMEEGFERLAKYFYFVVNKLKDAVSVEIQDKPLLLEVDEFLFLEYDISNMGKPKVSLNPNHVKKIFKVESKGFQLRIYEILKENSSIKHRLLHSKWVS